MRADDRDLENAPVRELKERNEDAPPPTEEARVEHEYQIPPAVKFAWLAAYFMFSLLLTLYNKLVLGVFPFPWLLTCLHSTCSALGTYALMKFGYFEVSRLGWRENLALLRFSVLFTANIAVSNLSLSMVNLAFFQIIRTTVPIFTVLIYRVWFGRSYSNDTYLSLLPIILGAALTTMGECKFTDIGFLVTILGVVLAAVKTVVTNRMMTGSLALPAIELLMRMSPAAAAQSFIYAIICGELSAFSALFTNPDPGQRIAVLPSLLALVGNGFLAFLLNIASFQTNKVAGALTISVCGNLKQCITVALGILAFGDFKIDLWNGSGIAVTTIGAALYSKAELDSKRKKAGYAPVPMGPTSR